MIMVRPKGQPRKILYKILGKPTNMNTKEDKRWAYIKRRLLAQETTLVR